MSIRALIIGSDRDYCYILKEFLALRDLYVTVVLNYKEGMDRLFYEKPDLAIIEATGGEPIESHLEALKSSDEYEIADFNDGGRIKPGTKNVLVFDDKTQINSLLDFLRRGYTDRPSEQAPDSENEGSLGSKFYPSLLLDIHNKKKSGILSISSNTRFLIYFINGNPVFAEGGDIDTAIGRILLDSGKINEETYEKAVDLATKNKQKFGQILFEMGITSPHELSSFLEFQIQEKITKGFYCINGRYAFKSGDEFVDRIVSYRIDLSKVIYEGVKRYIDADRLEEINPVIVADPKLRSDINGLGLKPKELRFVQLLKEKSTVKEVLAGSRLDKTEALKLLFFLSLYKLVDITGISPDMFGRDSIEKLIRENETAAIGNVSPDITADFENLFGELKDPESGPETGGSPGSGDKDPDFNIHSGEEEIPYEPEPEIEIMAEGRSQFGPSSGMDEEDMMTETSTDALLPNARRDERSEPVFYAAGPEEETALRPAAGGESSEDEIGLELNPVTAEPDHSKGAEHPFAWSQEESAPYNNGSPEPESGPSADTPGIARENTITDQINSLFQPYVVEGEDQGDDPDNYPAGNEVEFMPPGQPSNAAFEWDEANASTGKSHSDEFSERVIEFLETIEQKDHYEILGVSRDASTEEIRDAYYKLVKCYHPDVNPNADHDMRVKAEEIFNKITTAYEALSETDKRQQYDSHEELSVLKSQAKYIYEAEMTFKKGITMLVQRDYAEAEKKFREAVGMNPDEAAYSGALAWARFLAAEDKSAVLEEVRNSLEIALKMNDKIPENYYYLGSLYKYNNDLRKAERYFEEAIELAPDYIEAKREIRLIKNRKTTAKNDKKIEKNFWSSLFKK